MREVAIFNQTKLLLPEIAAGVGSAGYDRNPKYGNSELRGNKENSGNIRDSCFYPDNGKIEYKEVIQNPYYGMEDVGEDKVVIVKRVENPYYNETN